MSRQIAVIGLGLIGGSIAMGLKEFEDFKRVGVDVSQPTLRYALEQGIVDQVCEDPREALAQALPATAAEDVCRFVLTGESGESGVDMPALETAFNSRCYGLQLRDRTRPAEDIWRRAGEDSMRGLFLQDLRQRWESAQDEEQRRQIALAVRFGLAALDGRYL